MDSAGERFEAIRAALADRNNILTVKDLCELAGVSRSGYYNWVRSEKNRELREAKDRAAFEQILEAYRFRGYAGLDPSVKQSGEFKSNQNRMSKRGSPYLRRAIWLASTVAVHRDPMFQTYYEKKISEGLHYMNVIGHVSRKMTAVIFAVLRDGQPYQPILQSAG